MTCLRGPTAVAVTATSGVSGMITVKEGACQENLQTIDSATQGVAV